MPHRRRPGLTDIKRTFTDPLVGGIPDEPIGTDTTTEPGFDLSVFRNTGHRKGESPFFRRFIKGIELDENFISNLIDKVNETENIVDLKEIFDDILANNPGSSVEAREVGDAITERTLELGDIDPLEASVSEFKIANRAVKERLETEELAETQRGQIEDFAGVFGRRGRELGESLTGRESTARQSLADILSQQGTSLFETTAAQRAENLQAGGLGTSESAVARADARAIQELESQRLGQLAGFDVNSLRRQQQFESGVFAGEQDILGGGLSTFLGGNQEALNREFDLRLAGLNRGFSETDASRFAPRQNNRFGTTNALITGGFDIASAFVDPLSRFLFRQREPRAPRQPGG